MVESSDTTIDEQLIHFSTEAGALFLDGMGDGIWLMNDPSLIINSKVSGRTYLETRNNHQFINNTSFSILQATRTRISKTEYISCPSCGRTLFDLQETTAKIRAVTHHLKGVKIAIMGCIVNGPGEMADADFGYVGSGPGKITLYKGKDVVKRSVNSDVAVEELINILKENEAWIDPDVKSIIFQFRQLRKCFSELLIVRCYTVPVMIILHKVNAFTHYCFHHYSNRLSFSCKFLCLF